VGNGVEARLFESRFHFLHENQQKFVINYYIFI